LVKAAGKAGGIPLPIATRIISQACAGLHAAHELRDEANHLVGLVHRDVSPQNLLITFDGVVKVVDFGVAKAAGRASAETSAGQIKGKAAYMSPEQARGGDIDRRTDIFALGIILYMMTTGTHPFRGENDIATMYAITSDAPVAPPTQLVPSYPRTLERVVLKALAKDKNERFATANDFLRALDHALPASMRVSTDDVVADFVKKLLSARHEQRQKALKTAQKLADERASGRTSLELSQMDLASHSGFTPISSASMSALQRRRSGAELSPIVGGRGSVTTTSATSQPSVQLDDSDIISEGRPKRGWTVAAAGVVLVAAAAGGGYFALRPMRAASVPPPPVVSVAAVSATALPSAPPAASSAPQVVASAVASAEPVDAATPAAKLSVRVRAITTAKPTTEPTSAPTAKSTSGSTFVSPVRNPGF
jgi:serine/threonine-protein kinase